MKEILEEYGGILAGCMGAGIILVFADWCLRPEGPVGVLEWVFAKITLGGI